ncbi:hypothetical protein FVO59_09260 [Microbacterium esteraromaticum]|uniref:Uncharacterized protein n=1 Tax=Microbacterium esteraromaticum TaxID=57043 RepID=A0A7D8ABR7_9MICO|nr:hypothetical protein [Microbacterium esteraromaticum]QMU97381.1 hypothetical protein FVO59_09260 [Microbacterium esteraromaticum]
MHALIARLPALVIVSSVHSQQQLTELLGAAETKSREVDITDLPRSLAAVVSAGHYVPAGEFGWRTSQERRVPHFVVQHGLLTPFAPPLPHGATLLAFSDDDAAFWASERSDIEGIAVGAQLLWDTSTTESKTHPSGPPVYLGQLHGSELPRRGKTRSTARFWRQTGAIYRPHPFEADRLSRAQHAIWQARGMRIDRSNLPIRELGGPIVGAFSTGILEAAASGFPAWAYYENPPRWLEEFWDRYRIHRWGADAAPTPAPPRPAIEPAQAIADAVLAATGER